MKKTLFALFLLSALTPQPSLYALPRDAAAALNRCGDPMRGDETILENSLAGGRRLLKYERGILNFNRVANSGWTFTYGIHGSSGNLTAQQMEEFMPCLKDALADSALPGPLPQFTKFERAEVSMKRAYQVVILYTCILVLLTGGVLFLMSRKSRHSEALVLE